MDDCTAALAAVAKHQNRCAALVAVLVEQIQATAGVEGRILSLDAWQQETSFMCLRSEIATVLHVPKGAAGRLMRHGAVLVRELPATLGAMQEGWLGWEHAVIIAEEVSLLREAGVDQHLRDAFEELLLDKAEDSTNPSFREKARRARERAYPQTLVPRTRRALADRHMRVSRGQDGMSWLTLFASSPAIEAIFTQCTSTAHAVQGPHETRTLTQLRANIATILLLGQSMEQNHLHTPTTTSTPATAATTTTAGTTATAASTTGLGPSSLVAGFIRSLPVKDVVCLRGGCRFLMILTMRIRTLWNPMLIPHWKGRLFLNP